MTSEHEAVRSLRVGGNRRALLGMMTALALAFVSESAARVQERHAQFVLLGKTANYRQATDGSVTFLNTTFFGEIFLNPGATVTNGFVTGPGEANEPFRFGEGEVLFFAADRYDSLEELNRRFPDGSYYFHFDTPDGNILDLPVAISSMGLPVRRVS